MLISYNIITAQHLIEYHDHIAQQVAAARRQSWRGECGVHVAAIFLWTSLSTSPRSSTTPGARAIQAALEAEALGLPPRQFVRLESIQRRHRRPRWPQSVLCVNLHKEFKSAHN